MKPPLPPPPEIQGQTPGERMSNALRTVLRVPKEAILKAEAQEQKKRERQRKKGKRPG